MKNIVYRKLESKIRSAKDTDIIISVLILSAIIFYLSWELGRAYARM